MKELELILEFVRKLRPTTLAGIVAELGYHLDGDEFDPFMEIAGLRGAALVGEAEFDAMVEAAAARFDEV